MLPGVVRQKLMVEFPADFFPVEPSRSRHGYRMDTTRSDDDIVRGLQGARIGDLAVACLSADFHAQHASVAFGDHRNVRAGQPNATALRRA